MNGHCCLCHQQRRGKMTPLVPSIGLSLQSIRVLKKVYVEEVSGPGVWRWNSLLFHGHAPIESIFDFPAKQTVNRE